MADLNIDAAKARAWNLEVQNELAQVEVLLTQVHECCNENPTTNDPVAEAIVDAGNYLEERWTALTSTFKQVSLETGEAIEQIAKGINRAIENFRSNKQ